MLFMVAYLFL